jgi:hypothetical protein
MTATAIPTSLPLRIPAPTRRPANARSPVDRAVTGTVTAARFAGHFVAACVSVAVLGVDADL